jgi:hypothetical protein
VKGIAIREVAAASGLVIAAFGILADVFGWTGGCQERSGGIEKGISAEKANDGVALMQAAEPAEQGPAPPGERTRKLDPVPGAEGPEITMYYLIASTKSDSGRLSSLSKSGHRPCRYVQRYASRNPVFRNNEMSDFSL